MTARTSWAASSVATATSTFSSVTPPLPASSAGCCPTHRPWRPRPSRRAEWAGDCARKRERQPRILRQLVRIGEMNVAGCPTPSGHLHTLANQCDARARRSSPHRQLNVRPSLEHDFALLQLARRERVPRPPASWPPSPSWSPPWAVSRHLPGTISTPCDRHRLLPGPDGCP